MDAESKYFKHIRELECAFVDECATNTSPQFLDKYVEELSDWHTDQRHALFTDGVYEACAFGNIEVMKTLFFHPDFLLPCNEESLYQCLAVAVRYDAVASIEYILNEATLSLQSALENKVVNEEKARAPGIECESIEAIQLKLAYNSLLLAMGHNEYLLAATEFLVEYIEKHKLKPDSLRTKSTLFKDTPNLLLTQEATLFREAWRQDNPKALLYLVQYTQTGIDNVYISQFLNAQKNIVPTPEKQNIITQLRLNFEKPLLEQQLQTHSETEPGSVKKQHKI